MNIPQARCYVEVSRSIIAANYRAVRDAVASEGARVIAVVKADAYGHGSIEVSKALVEQGAEWLAVSSVEEGVALRRAGIPSRILVMAGIMPWECGALAEFNLTPVIHSLEELRLLNERCAGIQVHLKIDTGMNRLGALAEASEIIAALHAAPRVQVEGLMSHFASAADFTSEQTDAQIAAFHQMESSLTRLGFAAPIRHFASTNAVAYPRRDAWMSMVRTGHAIYGYVSPARGHAPHAILRVRPALSWRTRIVLVKEVPAGSRIGYGGAFVAPSRMRIAVLSAGYADGIPHRLSNRGKVIAGGRFAPIVGPVSMDLTTIDITASPEMKPGDVVTILGREGDVSLDAQQIARTAGTISYNVLCGISARVKRFYID